MEDSTKSIEETEQALVDSHAADGNRWSVAANRGSEITPDSPRLRKTVPLPETLPELQQAAALHLCPGRMVTRPLRLFHKGRQLYDKRVKEINDGDVVIAREELADGRTDSRPATVCSTHHSDYVWFDSAFRTKPPLSHRGSVQGKNLLRDSDHFDGRSSYHYDFPWPDRPGKATLVEFPSSKASIGGFDEGNRQSCYREFFVRHEGEATGTPASDCRYSAISNQNLGKAFEGRSCYKIEFPRWKAEMAQAAKASIKDNTSTLTDAVAAKPFEGQSIYASHYLRHAVKRPESVGSWSRPSSQAGNHPFVGMTEYRRNYRGAAPRSARTPLVHLELDSVPLQVKASRPTSSLND